MRVDAVGSDVESDRPRLLVTLRPRDDVGAAIDRALPEVAWAYLDRTAPDAWRDVEAVLADSLGRSDAIFDDRSTPRLRFVQRIYTGLDGFPFDRFGPAVAIAGNVGAFAPYVAEHAILLALAALRDLPRSIEMVREGRLRPVATQRTLYGAMGLVLGYGEIGTEIGRRLAAFGARVAGLNRTGRPAPGVERMFSSEQLSEALSAADLVFDVRPLTRRTTGSIGRAEFERMRPDATLVAVGRAGTVDEGALYGHLQSHPEFRAAFDVWWNEDYRAGTLGARFPLASLPNFVGTPHCAGAVAGAEGRALDFALENLVRFFRDGRPRFVVDRAEYPD